MQLTRLTDLKPSHQKVIVRVDFNVPLNEDGSIGSSLRISETLPTLNYLLNQGCSLILLSHLGRPKGEKKGRYSLKPCAEELAKLLKRPVEFSSDCLGKETEEKVSLLPPQGVLLLENLRFYPAEEHPEEDPSFAKTLASYGDLFVNDAFSACHRSHSSITEIPKYFPQKTAAGFLVENEIRHLEVFSKEPPRPFHAIIGGSKVSSKLEVLHKLLQKADALYIGGAMSFTFLKALGEPIGNSLFEEKQIPAALDLIKECKEKKITLHLPIDVIVADSFSNEAHQKILTLSSEGIPDGWQGMDIGPLTLTSWQSSLKEAHSIFWNGPLGVFEMPSFSQGTFQLVEFLSKLSSYRVVGGGDSASAVEKTGLEKCFNHISTGGGASLEFLEKGSLPGIEAFSH